MITRTRFHNMIRSLWNLETEDVSELSHEDQLRFVRDPLAFFIRCPDKQADVIFAAVMKRQDFSNDYGAPDNDDK